MIKDRFEISKGNTKLTDFIKTPEQLFLENPYYDEKD